MRGYVYARRWVEDCQVRLWCAQGRLSDLSDWLKSTDLSVHDEITFLRELEHIILARALVSVGSGQPTSNHLRSANALLSQLLTTAEAAGWIGKVIEILVLEALALEAQGMNSEAMTALGRALALGKQEGYARIFLDEGLPMANLLARCVARGIERDYAQQLLADYGDARPVEPSGGLGSRSLRLSDSVPVVDDPLAVEPLSEREREVLALISVGLSNREVAQRLYLTLNTVKVHTRNIYRKLGVHSRTQAVTRARNLGIL